ncbi:hypothetical protein BH10PSE9_BH10PSE9_05150 [soil metagenome]
MALVRIVTCFVMLALPGAAAAAEWHYFASFRPKPYRILNFIDIASIASRSDKTLGADWAIYQETDTNPSLNDRWKVHQVSIDCTAGTYAIVSTKFMREDGTEARISNQARPVLEPAGPKTPPESLIAIACKKATIRTLAIGAFSIPQAAGQLYPQLDRLTTP